MTRAAPGPRSPERLAAIREAVAECQRRGLRPLMLSDLADLLAAHDAVVRERDAADEALAACQAQAAGRIQTLEARVAALAATLRDADCPRPFPGERTVGDCVDAGHCGCAHGAALALVIEREAEQRGARRE